MSPPPLSSLLAEQTARRPDGAALTLAGETVSYARLAELSGRLATTLAAAGVGRGDRVGILLPRGLEAYVAIFAALRLGAAYVPLDPTAPPARVADIARDCGLAALVAAAPLVERFLAAAAAPPPLLIVAGAEAAAAPIAGGRAVTWDDALAAPVAPPAPTSTGDELAAVLYTSGSTGRPKGVMIAHRAVDAFVAWSVAAFGLDATDRVAAVAALHFDLSLFDLFATLAAGGTVLPLPPGSLLRPQEIPRWLVEQGVTTWYSTPSTLVLLLEEGQLEGRAYPALRRILFAGEVFPTRHLRRLRAALPHTALYNLYGPTETNVVTWEPIDAAPAGDRVSVAIGRPCAGTDAALLDAAGREVPDGAEGELWVRGPTVTPGYWRDPKASAVALGPHPGRGGAGVWYRTGDLAHRDVAGKYHFHGRRDAMVKVRGYRVELGEVEVALNAHPAVREAAVTAVAAERGLTLRAAVVPRAGARLSALALKLFLGDRLPAYMIPAEIRICDALPKTSTGKVDRRALAEETIPRDAG